MFYFSLYVLHLSGPGKNTRQPCTKQLFHRVITAADKGMAAQDAAQTKPHAFDNAITGNSLDSVLGTGWSIPTTGGEKR
jgi:hypothetical protein